MMLKKKKIGNIINLKRGYDLPSTDRKTGDIPVVSSSGITDFHDEHKKDGEGVITGRYGTLGEIFYVDGKYWPLNTTLYVTDFKGNHPKFIYYFLKTLKLERFNGAAAVPGLDRNVIHKIQVLFIDQFDAQQKIASILSTYDELIENNKQRIKLLEEMAEEIYNEWFVRFRFPGYESTKFFDEKGKEVPHGTVGALPEGWEKVRINKITINHDSKREPLSSMVREKISGVYPYYGAAKIIDYINDFIFDGKYLLLAEDGSVITTEGYPVLQFVNEKFWVSNHAHVLEGKSPISTEYVYLALRKYSIIGLVTGAAQPKINQENLNRVQVINPEQHITRKFNNVVVPMFGEVLTLIEKSKLLQQTRDLLLPRLISGKLSVEHLINTDPESLAMAAEPEPVYGK